MRLIELTTGWTVALDILAWLLIHLGVAWTMARRPAAAFDPDAGWFRIRRFEDGGRFYERYLRIKSWKPRLPDGASLLGRHGFPKRRLESRSRAYLRRFAVETCRAEWTHCCLPLFAPLFWLWNRPAVGWLMLAYILAENLPLIAAQRYNRARLQRALRSQGTAYGR